jgi:hypothetical protein
MARSTRRRTALVIALLCCTLGSSVRPAAAEPVRVFLVGNKQRIQDATSVATFRAKMFALVDASQRGPGLVQDGVDDVASHLAPRDPSAPARAVVHFPESVGLIAGLIGTRGIAARDATSATGAFASLLGPYADPIAYYTGVYPELAAQPIRGLVVALTDVLYRSVYETFRDIAVEQRIWLSVSFDAAPARRVDAAEDADLVARLRDPDEPERTYAYVATSPLPRNFVFLFDPEGNLIVPDGDGGLLRAPAETGGELPGSSAKAYLTPIEQTLDKPGGGLSLASASVRDLDVLDTPVGAIGVVISKDAWMPDVNERFDLKGASFLLQSEAFSSWAYDLTEWAPDVFKVGGYANLQNRGGFLYNAAPCLTGNLFDTTFDGQSALLVKRRDKTTPGARTPDNAFIGQLADRGFVRVAPWIVPDPPAPGSPPQTLAARRAELVSFGANLLPGSGVACADSLAVGACENGYREAVIFADLDVPPSPAAGDGVPVAVDRTRRVTSFGANQAIAAGATGRQRHPRVAARGRRAAVVWDDTRAGGQPAVYLALSSDAGASFSAPIKVSDARAGDAAELDPDIAMSDDEIVVVWQALEHGGDDDAATIRLARFTHDGAKHGDDVRVDGGTSAAGRWQPALALLADGSPVVAWIDERDHGPDGVALEHVYLARPGDGTDGDARAIRVDDGVPVLLAASLDNRWSPAILAVGDTVHVAWTDFRDYNWDVYTARSTDGGRTFAASQRVNGFADFERISDAPALAAGRGNDVRLAWTDVRAREPDGNLFTARSSDGGVSWESDRQLDLSRRGFDPDRDRASLQHAVALAKAGERGFAAWQDDRAGNQDILFAALDDARGGVALREDRVDDTGDGPSNQYRPHLAVAGEGSAARCIVVWEDDRDGRMQIYAASRACIPARTPPLPVR